MKDETRGTQTDRVFAEPHARVDDFDFTAAVASVFDDMVDRSVPYYREMQRMAGELVCDFATHGSRIYDMGCATCTTFLAMHEVLDPALDVEFVGIDSSQHMLDKARAKLQEANFARPYQLRCEDLDTGVNVENASVTLLLLTLQFLRPLNRHQLLGQIAEGTNDGGAVILIEKVLSGDSTFNRLFINHYYEMKRRHGYSELEISQKREALENVLIPYRFEEDEELLKRSGFSHVEVFFKWYNFCGIVAYK